MSETALVHVGQQALQQGGQGLNFNDPLFQLKPATLSINQRMTQAEGAIPGKFRIVETGDHFDSVTVALLAMPTAQRQWHQGDREQLNRTPDNMMCFSRDCINPDARAKVPQAMRCDRCPKADWTPWREKKEATGINDLKLIPACDHFYYAVFIDTAYKMPLRMYIRGGENKANFEQGMQDLARKFKLLQSQGKNPNIFDLRFTMVVKPGKKKTNYVLVIDGKSTRMITDEERAEFGDLYLSFVNRGKRSAEEEAEDTAVEQIAKVNDVIDAEVLQPGTESNVIEGEIVI